MERFGILLLLLVAIASCVACDGRPSPSPRPETEESPAGAGNPRSGPPRTARRSSLADSLALHPPAVSGNHGRYGRSARDAVRQVLSLAGGNAQDTLIVWIVDRTTSSHRLVREVHDELQHFYTLGAGSRPIEAGELLTSVVTFGADVHWPISEATSDGGAVLAAFAAIEIDTSGREATFAAVRASLERHLAAHARRERNVMIVIVSDEAGDDAPLLDQFLARPARYALPIYVIGSPAPLGRIAALPEAIETPTTSTTDDSWLAIRQGPESLFPEVVDLRAWSIRDGHLLDSGFGPFALERLCRLSGGSFLAIRPEQDSPPLATPASSSWPQASAVALPEDGLERYSPDYVSEAEYRRLLEANAARMALHRAAQQTWSDVGTEPQLQFPYTSEADLNRRLTEAQKAAAALQPRVDALYEILRAGEPERAQVAEPRWRAGYDLAMGRTLAAKVRTDGYNAMLALLKRGRSFSKSDSTMWVLVPAPTLEADSRLENLADRARSYLDRVVAEHPDTPWAASAARELEMPIGWKWDER